MLGTRGIWEDGWKAAAVHAPLTGKGHFDKDEWQLYHVDEDRSESKDLAKQYPEKLQALIKAWFEEAEKNLVLPLDDRTAVEMLGVERPSEEAPRERYIYYPGHLAGPGGRRRQRPRPVVQDPRRRRDHRSELLRRDLRPRLALRRSLAVHQGQEAPLRLQLPRHQAGAEVRLRRRAEARQVHARHGVHPGEGGRARRVPGQDEALRRTTRSSRRVRCARRPGKFTLSGDGLCVGYDSGDAVSKEYKSPGTFKGGTILGVGVTVEKAQYLDLEKEAERAFNRD